MRKALPYILFVVLFFLYFFCYQGVLSHVIYSQEQHHLFLFSKTFFSQHIQSMGWMSYFTVFVVQFFFIPILGSIILAGILSSIYLLTNNAIKKITGQNDLFQLSLIPSLYLFLYSMSVDHSLIPIVSTFIGLFILFIVNKITVSQWSFFYKIGYPSLRKKNIYIIFNCFLIALYAGVSFYLFAEKYSINERVIITTGKYIKEKKWDEALKQTERHLIYGSTSQLMFYFHNLALYHTGKLPYNLLDYPQKIGVKGLYFPRNENGRVNEYEYLIYEDLGHINEAQRWVFEGMVVWGETAPHLINLARYNIINKRANVAKRFINLLKQSLFYKKEANRLEQLLPSAEVPDLRKPLDLVEGEPARFTNVMNIAPDLLYTCEQDSSNRMAFEYLMSYFLLSNDVSRFVDNLKFFHNFNYPQMSRIYEEAIYLYKLGVDEETFSKLGFTISKNTEKRFQEYYNLYQNQDQKRLRSEFGNTYWFYLHFISPYGDKIRNN